MKNWISENCHSYLRKGGKIARRARVKTLVRALENIAAHERGVTTPHQVGRKHIHQFYARHAHLSDRTLSDYGYSFELLWNLLGRPGSPPKPSLDR